MLDGMARHENEALFEANPSDCNYRDIAGISSAASRYMVFFEASLRDVGKPG
jgi:hypothetical protein